MKKPFGAGLFLLVLLGGLPAIAQTPAVDAVWRSWFGGAATLAPLAGDTGVVEVRDMRGSAAGWVFRTDRVAPAVRGKRGEIGLTVGLGTDGRIRGVKVSSHREDKKWFDMIKPPFYAAFKGIPADGSGAKPDTVTGATVSSAAMVKDVLASSATVLAMPAVKARLQPAPKAPAGL